MSISFKIQFRTLASISVLLLGACATSNTWADESSANDVPPPTPAPWAQPVESGQTSPPPPQESWHVIPSKVKTNPESTEEPRYHSNAQRIAGGILIGLGAVSLAGFGVVAVIADHSNSHGAAEGAGLFFVFVGLPLLVGGIACEAVGIPLYLNGSKPAGRGDARANVPRPMAFSVGVGPQSVALKLTF